MVYLLGWCVDTILKAPFTKRVGSSITAYLREIGIGFSQAAATPAAAQAQDEKADGQKGVRP